MSDRTRHVVVTVSAVFMIVGTLFGTGVIGTSVSETAGGSLSATATLVAPAVPAFSIWSVIYLGLVAFVVWQWLPANAESQRARRTGLLASLSMILNAVWLLVTQVGALWVSVVVILALAVTLGELMRRLGTPEGTRMSERVVVDATFGLYLGWVAVAAVANVTATLVASGLNPGMAVAQWLAVAVLAVAAAVGAVLAFRLGGRLSIAVAMAWGLAWIAVGRLTTEPASAVTGVAAVLAAIAVGAAALVVRSRARAVGGIRPVA